MIYFIEIHPDNTITKVHNVKDDKISVYQESLNEIRKISPDTRLLCGVARPSEENPPIIVFFFDNLDAAEAVYDSLCILSYSEKVFDVFALSIINRNDMVMKEIKE